MSGLTSAEGDFIAKCQIAPEEWASLEEYKLAIVQIFESFQSEYDEFTEVAVALSRLVQKIPHVHSVRWRVKDPTHLVRKIIRKIKSGNDKYVSINSGNYKSIVTDLVGIRALHLFKGDNIPIHNSIVQKWNLYEDVTVYHRKGDTDNLTDSHETGQIRREEHPSGYRSVHYIIESIFTKEKMYAELQVRTIFEEGWSEIDHTVRYPELSSNELVSHFLTIFNRLSGAADEMGTFVFALSAQLAASSREREQAEQRLKESEERLTSAVSMLEQSSKEKRSLEAEVRNIRTAMTQHMVNSEALQRAVTPDLRNFFGHSAVDAHMRESMMKLVSAPNISALAPEISSLSRLGPNLADFGIVGTSRKKDK